MLQTKIIAVLEAFAVGDALGMPTEFMRREEIRGRFGLVDRILDPSISWTHPGLPFASVTDDTEQLWRLLGAYQARGISAETTVECLLAWVRETDAVAKRYIGPSSLKALTAIENGADPREAGKQGTTCGGIMRSPAAVLATLAREAGACARTGNDEALGGGGAGALERAVLACCLPTHNTRAAIEAAMAYAFALHAALCADSAPSDTAGRVGAILDAGLAGAVRGAALAPEGFPGPSSGARIAHLRAVAPAWRDADEAMDFLYGVIGSGIESADVCAAVFGIFMFAKDEVMLALRMGASLGGDTDTIAALAGALCAACAGGHDIPRGLVDTVVAANGLEVERTALSLCRPRL